MIATPTTGFPVATLLALPLLTANAVMAQDRPELWVDPVGGSDRLGNGRPVFPVQTIGRALELAGPNTILRLEPGTYSLRETFPIVLPPTVSLQGNRQVPGDSVVIVGGGIYGAQDGSERNVAIVATGNGTIRGIAVSNPDGIGVWVEGSGNPTLRDNTFSDSKGMGLAIATAGQPIIRNNTFTGNGGRALSLGNSTNAEVTHNTFTGNAIGIWIGNAAMPHLQNNRLQENGIGIEITGITRPVLRDNVILDSLSTGIKIASRTPPDLGSAREPGRNVIQGSRRTDIFGLDPAEAIAAGNRFAVEDPQERAVVPAVPAEPRPAPANLPPAPVSVASRENGVPIFVPPPATPAAAGQSFRVFVEANSVTERARVVALVPQAFSSSYDGRAIMQIGVFGDRENAEKIRQQLERFGLKVTVVPG